jgi:diguanylate cyclase (GGDEF)-like protein
MLRFYRNNLPSVLPGMLSVAFCLCSCLMVVLIFRRWKKRGLVSSEAVQGLTECLYWAMTLWGMFGSYRHYVAGNQMLIFDTVQVCFVFTLTCHPLRALLHVVGAYGIFYIVLQQFDNAAQIQGLNYFALAALLLAGYLLHFRKQLSYVRLQAAQRDQIHDLEMVSSHDALTGLKNRYALRRDFPSYVGKEVWVIMADIDYFKQYNDTYGHAVGDRFLSAVSDAIREQFGAEHTYRYGGDEFLIFVENESQATVELMLHRWQQKVSRISVETAVEWVTPRCSYGLSGGLMEDEAALRNHIRKADELLYDAKGERR